jgi:glycosyltransferase involved in cell wall biosynthesis
MAIQVVGHTSFLGQTGYNAHSQAFFTTLNKHLPVRIRNYSHTKDLSIVPDAHKRMIIEQSWVDPPYKIGTPFQPNPKDLIVNIVLNESHHYFFYDKYESPKIAYNVWESTKQIPEYFNRILEYDQFWCPTEWQRQCTIKQGYPEDRVKVVPEGVDGNLFFPSTDHKDLLYSKYNIPRDAFVFMIFGRWDYRKATEEMISAWYRKFGDIDNCYLILSVDNPFSSDPSTIAKGPFRSALNRLVVAFSLKPTDRIPMLLSAFKLCHKLFTLQTGIFIRAPLEVLTASPDICAAPL